jgi:hypothetical protein
VRAGRGRLKGKTRFSIRETLNSSRAFGRRQSLPLILQGMPFDRASGRTELIRVLIKKKDCGIEIRAIAPHILATSFLRSAVHYKKTKEKPR